MKWIDEETVEYLEKLTISNMIDIDHMNFLGYDPEIRINELKNDIRRSIRAIRTLRNRKAEKEKLEKENKNARLFLRSIHGNAIRPI